MLEAKATEYRAVSPRAVWLTAIDRFLMFTYALQLYKAGITVKKYGAGSVVILAPKYCYREIYEIASSIGLVAPTYLLTDMDIQQAMQNYG
jgi:hypothetical protein